MQDKMAEQKQSSRCAGLKNQVYRIQKEPKLLPNEFDFLDCYFIAHRP